MIRLVGFIISFVLILPCTGQQNYTWHFGSTAGLNFIPTGTGPVPSVVTNSAMVATEGSAAICDDAGKTLFYTNGRTIYNRNNVVMSNGAGLMGHESAFQSSIIIPLPNSSRFYYVFTADAVENNYRNGYRYSVVDMNGDGGNGTVTFKNILLYAPSSERLTAARHANGIDAWIITNDHSSNIFRSWLLTCTGLSLVPVVSTTGAKLDTYEGMNTGSMKVSPDGLQLCQTHFPNADGSGVENFFQLFDFNNATGVISNPITINAFGSRYFACEYSPDSKLLYLTKADGEHIDQFQCKLPTPAQVVASTVVIPSAPALCGLQLAPDGKIYLTTVSSTLSVIKSPNTPGLGCGFVANGVDLLGNFGSLNLPSFINDMSVDVYNYFNVRILDTCAGRVQFEGHTNLGGPVTWAWDFGDSGTSDLQNPQHVFTNIRDLYLVKLTITPAVLCGSIKRSKYIFPAGLVINANFRIINNCDSGYIRFENLSTQFPEYPIQYLWDLGDGNFSSVKEPRHTYSLPGTYQVKLKLLTNVSCLDDSLSLILDQTALNITASADQVVDEGNSVQLNVSGAGSGLRWQPSKWLNSDQVANPVSTPLDDIMYIVTATNDAGCTDKDTVYIKVNPKTELYISSAFTPNNDGRNDNFKPFMSLQYTINTFNVYNRWGQLVFSTTDPGKGWDGKINGLLQDSGLYIWYLKVTNRKKEVIEKNGTVMLIR